MAEAQDYITAWAVHLEPPVGGGGLAEDEVRIWTGPWPLVWRSANWMPGYGILDVALPGDSIGGGYEHARITVTWPQGEDLADYGHEIPKVDVAEILADGLPVPQPCHIHLLESLDQGRTWMQSPGASDFHGTARGFELAESSAVIDVAPLSGDIDKARRRWWSADDRAKEAQEGGFVDNSMRYMRRISTRLLSRFPGGPARYEDDYTP